jgi:hypothetical protein
MSRNNAAWVNTSTGDSTPVARNRSPTSRFEPVRNTRSTVHSANGGAHSPAAMYNSRNTDNPGNSDSANAT